ncbi:MoxR family ATPase [Nisaea acidiphila]|uniref:MoxR family ATPase n=1 Tax=Nisaea acidiphila TaxID=1862145 RepID=A0A9J7AX48_9PROT|nr:MoxR family ATPase [Nisaea acidiphila]UUX51856.1 MoxR family ATPase [Nisaea acidiphila]
MRDYRELQAELAQTGYIAEDSLVMALTLATEIHRPLLLEGEAGVGKTDIARALAKLLGTRLIRLQCYEGLDANATLYEWNYQRQLLAIRAREASEGADSAESLEKHIFSEDYLLRRPLLEAISQLEPPVLLIDEIDRADEEFEAFLLELLADYQVTVPELGTMEAVSIPHVVLTSNGTRALSDALRRRCLYSWVDYPDAEKERAILAARMPEIDGELARRIVGFVQQLRREDLEKVPGIAETLDWATALVGLKVEKLEDNLDLLQASLICLLKTEADQRAIVPEVTQRLLGKVA